MKTIVGNEHGSVLIMAVIAMLIMGVLSVSFSLLANIETTIGFNYKQQAQAEALAEAGLERARDALKTAASEPCGFTRWTSAAAVAGCGTPIGPLLFNNVALGPGQYSARVDNDCWIDAAHAVVPQVIQQAGCPTVTDTNETAVITAWATTTGSANSSGRARARAILTIDDPWKHVCSDHKADNGGYCNDPSNANGTPTVTPADPNDPNGPHAYDDLPRPYLGCSRVDPTVHKRPADLTGALQIAACAANNAMYTYTYPAHFAPAEPRFVVMGADPGVVAGAPNCNGGGQVYFGYFDCALTTPCPAAVCGALRPACVRLGDTRLPPNYLPTVAGLCPVGATGMVFIGDTSFPNVGDQTTQYTIYVLNGTATVFGAIVYGTLVVEGDSSNSFCPNAKDAEIKTNGIVWAGPNTTPAAVGWGPTRQYGYPIAVLIYDPDLADPTPAGTPQGTCADMGSAGGAGTTVHGLVYSGGEVEFNPVALDGSVVAFSIQTQSTVAAYGYNTTYGNAASPSPAGFPKNTGTQVTLTRKSFIVCATYSDDSGGGTACP